LVDLDIAEIWTRTRAIPALPAGSCSPAKPKEIIQFPDRKEITYETHANGFSTGAYHLLRYPAVAQSSSHDGEVLRNPGSLYDAGAKRDTNR